ncbi:MAG: ACP S-malonyltransferase [Pseudomonadota bacterium]
MTIAAVFPGQGAQSVGMLAELANEYPAVKERFAEASEVLGFDVWQMVQDGPAEVLAQTENTQPLLLTASRAVWDVLQAETDLIPAYAAGHSLGEYSALVCTGAMAFGDGLRLVRLRGRLMEAAVPRGQGGMAAIMGLADEQISDCCAAVEGVVVAANFNAPGQVAIAGEIAAVEAAAEACKAAGAKRAVMLDVSGPFHSPLMEAAKEEFSSALADTDLTMPSIPVVQNVTARPAADLEVLRDNLIAQISAPVLWAQCVGAMVDSGVDQFVECGPGNVLAGLIRRITKPTPTQTLATPEGIAAAKSL